MIYSLSYLLTATKMRKKTSIYLIKLAVSLKLDQRLAKFEWLARRNDSDANRPLEKFRGANKSEKSEQHTNEGG